VFAKFWKIGLLLAVAAPSVVARLTGTTLPPLAAMLTFGAGVVAASFLLAWAAEVAQLDVSASLATAALALVAVLPEYAVDLYFAFTAGHRPEYGAYAAANMTGSNRLLVGLGWPLVALLFGIAARRRKLPAATITLRPQRRLELAFLATASVYAFIIPLKGTLSVIDSAILLALFGAYLWRTGQQERQEPELHGMPANLAELPRNVRRSVVVGFFVFAALVIGLAAKPFADALVSGGRHLGVDEFLLVQWLAPLSSEAPELLVAGILALHGHEDAALGTLLSSKVNQWTLLVGSLALAHAVGGGGLVLHLDARQNEEFLLTAGQAFFAVALLLRLRLRPRAAILLFAAFALQLAVPQPSMRLVFAGIYIALGLGLFLWQRKEIAPLARALVREPAVEAV
jgi:cation:H+ antiporter